MLSSKEAPKAMTNTPQSMSEELEALFNRAGLQVNYNDEEDPTAQLIHETAKFITQYSLTKQLEARVDEQGWFRNKYEDELRRTDGRARALGISFDRTAELKRQLGKDK